MNDDTLRCPRCSSAHVQGARRGFGAGKAVGGGLLLGPVGLLAGFLGSKRVELACLNCGAQWPAGAAKRGGVVQLVGALVLLYLAWKFIEAVVAQ